MQNTSNNINNTNNNNNNNNNVIKKVIAVSVAIKPTTQEEIKENIDELIELIKATNDQTVIATCSQIIKKISPATLIGKGKIQEIKNLIEIHCPHLIIFDHKLTGIQTRNLEKNLQITVLDRNQLILNIFAQRAQTFEGKLQVELALMLDQMPRMVNAWMGSLSRLGGGIGTRGPGEKALEIDRRRTRDKIHKIKKKLENVRKNRLQHRQARKKNKIPGIALIGYTNSGKSSLLNTLTNANVNIKNQVFATLDPVTRKFFLNDTQAVITDTVGFIKNLPPHLIESFKATLEESAEADILLHVIDTANKNMNKQIEVVNELIHTLNWNKKPIIHVFNKVDIAPIEAKFKATYQPKVFISTITKEGINQLKEIVLEYIKLIHQEIHLFLPIEQEFLLYDLDKDAVIDRKEKSSQGILCYVKMPMNLIKKWEKFIT